MLVNLLRSSNVSTLSVATVALQDLASKYQLYIDAIAAEGALVSLRALLGSGLPASLEASIAALLAYLERWAGAS